MTARHYGYAMWIIISITILCGGVVLNSFNNRNLTCLDASDVVVDFNNVKFNYIYSIDHTLNNSGYATIIIKPDENNWKFSLQSIQKEHGRIVKWLINKSSFETVKLWSCRTFGLNYAVVTIDKSDTHYNVTEYQNYSLTTNKSSYPQMRIYCPDFLPFLCSNMDESKLPISVSAFQSELKRVLKYDIQPGKEDNASKILFFTSEYCKICARYEKNNMDHRFVPIRIEYSYPDKNECLILKSIDKVSSENISIQSSS